MARIGQNYSRIRIHGENRKKTIRESEFMSRISNRSIRESKFMARIEQEYSRIRIRGENRTKLFENQNSCREYRTEVFVWGIGGLVSPHDLRVHNHNNILVLKRFYFKLNKKISLSVSQCSSFRREPNNILPPKFPKFPATKVP